MTSCSSTSKTLYKYIKNVYIIFSPCYPKWLNSLGPSTKGSARAYCSYSVYYISASSSFLPSSPKCIAFGRPEHSQKVMKICSCPRGKCVKFCILGSCVCLGQNCFTVSPFVTAPQPQHLEIHEIWLTK